MFSTHHKLFSPKYYPSDEEVRITMPKQWLERLIIKFRFTVVESDASRAELLEFVETLRHECENKSLYEAWQFCGGINDWYTNWPHLMKLWQKVLVISSNIAISESGFSKQNVINSPLVRFIEIKHFGCFDVSIIMQNKVREYKLEGTIWVMVKHEEMGNSYFGLNILRRLVSCIFIYKRTWSDHQFCVKKLRFS